MIKVSICIPVFNFDVKPLLQTLLAEIKTYSIGAEIILIDDGSSDDIARSNEQSANELSVTYIRLEKNIGRSAIRNLFMEYAQADQLLFLDCDVMPRSKNFIQNYLNEAGKRVVCGGICYPDNVDEDKKLHWKYGTLREEMKFDKRNLRPYHHFLTGNFLVPKEILYQIRFNEEIKGYGYEDTLFAIELEQNRIELRHADLPVEHLKLDTATEFISKTKNAVRNLFLLYQMEQYKKLLPRYVKLIKLYETLSKFGLTKAGFFFYKTKGEKILSRLRNENTNLRLLDFYKLLFFISLMKVPAKRD